MDIVIATDLTDGSVPAVQWGFDFADHLEASGLEVESHLVHAVEARYPQVLDFNMRLSDPDNRETLRQNITEWVGEHLDAASRSFGVGIAEGRPEEVLEEAVEEHAAEWLVVGMTGQAALTRMIVGSTTEELAHGPPCHLAIAHPDHPIPNDSPTFLVGIDFTDASRRAVALGAELARTYDGELRIVHAVEPPDHDAYPIDTFEESPVQNVDELVDRMSREVATFVDGMSDELEGVEWETETITGYPTTALVRYVEDNDLDGLVLGTAGRTPMGDLLMGSVSRGIVKRMPRTVYLTRPEG
jgi:nucleotide-binding universal stress UspA family protein